MADGSGRHSRRLIGYRSSNNLSHWGEDGHAGCQQRNVSDGTLTQTVSVARHAVGVMLCSDTILSADQCRQGVLFLSRLV